MLLVSLFTRYVRSLQARLGAWLRASPRACLLAACLLTTGLLAPGTVPAAASVSGTPAAAAAVQPTILVMGDSLSAGYGIAVTSGWVTLLNQRLAAQGYEYKVVNASASGETTGGGLVRLPRALDLHKPALVVLELGGNDGLRGLPVEQMRNNLEAMIRMIRDRGAQVLLLGMQIPPNYGPAYAASFQSSYLDLAKRYQLPLVTFFMDGVALESELMQDDGIHPNVAGQPRLLDNVWPVLQPLLKRNVNAARKSGTGP